MASAGGSRGGCPRLVMPRPKPGAASHLQRDLQEAPRLAGAVSAHAASNGSRSTMATSTWGSCHAGSTATWRPFPHHGASRSTLSPRHAATSAWHDVATGSTTWTRSTSSISEWGDNDAWATTTKSAGTRASPDATSSDCRSACSVSCTWSESSRSCPGGGTCQNRIREQHQSSVSGTAVLSLRRPGGQKVGANRAAASAAVV
mmetsp:Transcript_66440/g.158998  ORF Transcript_66440/g.158998 Transcript_66440/m.158998 type:complete len:203 (+) Transcript_66440:891-1499(+)